MIEGSLILYALMVLLVIISIGKVKRPRDLFKKMGFKRLQLSHAGWALVYLSILIGMSFAIQLILVSLGMGPDLEKVSNIITQINFYEVLIVLCTASIVEEVFFRGYLQQKTNLWIASFIFAFFHITYGSFGQVIGAFFLGIILGKEFEQFKSLWPGIISHLGYNLVIIALMFSVGA